MNLYYPAAAGPVKICKKAEDGRHEFTPPSLNCNHCGFGSIIVGNEVLYVPTEKGIDYHQRTEPNVLLWGGRGSAKSTTGRWDAHMRALAYPGFKYVILRRTYPELEKTHLISVPREMKLLGGTYNHTKHIAHYPNGSRGFFSHCATEEDVLNLLGGEFYLAFFDEISTFEWEHFMKLASSVRAPVGSGLIPMVRAATNPLGESAMEVNKYWVDHSVEPDEAPDYNPNDWYSIRANIEDNPYLDAQQYRKRFTGLAEHIRKAWLDGEFAYENALFDFRPTTKESKPFHVIHDLDFPKILRNATIYRAIDAGWFPDPTVCLWIAHLGDRHIVFHEKTWYKTTAAEVADDIKEEDKLLARRVGSDFSFRAAITYCDPSMDINTTADVRTIKEIYEDHGVAMECSINKRDWFATAMHNALAEMADENTPRIQFYTNGSQGCPNLVKTIPQMRYDSKRPEFMADHKADHYVVTCCYYLLSHASDARSEYMNQPGGHQKPWMKEKNTERKPLGYNNVSTRLAR
jgi:phage terminase large subunit